MTIVAGGATTRRPGATVGPGGAVRECSGDPGPVPSRPQVNVGRLPPVANEPSVRVTDRFTDRQADGVARDTVEDLLIIGRARRDLDVGVLATAATTPRIDREQSAICAAGADGRIEAASRYDLDALSVQILARSTSQRTPEIDVGLRGHVTLTTYEHGRAVGSRTVPALDLLTVARRGDHYVIAGRTPRLPPPP